MRITIKPSEIIERSLWAEYRRFILPGLSTDEVNEIIKKDEEFDIKEQHAFVIGLLNCVYTPNIIYKLNQQLKSNLINKSFVLDDIQYINIKLLEDAALAYKNNFPDVFVSKNNKINKEIALLNDVIQLFIYNINQLEQLEYKRAKLVKCKQVKKIINAVVLST